MATARQIFAVDTNTGQVYIAGNLFVQSAEKAGDSWIVGNMISASSVIELTDGAIVLDGTRGTVRAFDPDALTSGTFTEISHGRVNQYLDGDLARSLTGVETGTCSNDTWVELVGRYTSLPRIIVSPQSMQLFNSNYAGQPQTFLCNVSAESIGTNRWRFKPLAQLVISPGAVIIPGPAIIIVSEELPTEAIRYETNEVTTGENTTHIQCDAVLGGSIWREDPTVNEWLDKGYCFWEDIPSSHMSGLIYPCFDYYQAKIEARLCYKKTSASSWTYGTWSAVQMLTYKQNVTVQLAASVSSGNYQVKVQFRLTTGTMTHDWHDRIEIIETNQCQVPSYTITKQGVTMTPTGAVNYLAVGR